MSHPVDGDRAVGEARTRKTPPHPAAPYLLAIARDGFRLAHATCLAPRSATPTGLLLVGELDDTAEAALALLARDWQLVSDRPTPLLWDGDTLVAHPRADAMLVAERRAQDSGVPYVRVRPGSTAVAINPVRRPERVAVAGIAVMQRRRPLQAIVEAVSGREKLERAGALFVGGALDTPEARSPEDIFAEHQRIAAVPMTKLRLETWPETMAIEGLLTWWAGLTTEVGT